MGRKPRMEPRKEYLENPRTSFLFSTPAEYRECFEDMTEKYLTPATKGKRLGKKTFRVVVHLPNKHHNDRDNYLAKMKGNWIDRTFLAANAPIPTSRIRWDSPSNPGVHLIMHTERGKRVEYFLTPSKTYAKGTMVNGQITFPTMMRNKHTYKNGKSVWRRSEKLVACPVQVGFFGVSASKSGEFKLTIQKPVVDCPKGLTQAGHAPAAFRKEWEPVEETEVSEEVVVAEAEGTIVHMAEEHYRAFYEAQGMDYSQLLKLGSENMENAQQTERNYYDPSTAMVGTDESLEGYTPSDSATVDLTSNQPTANYGAEGETATYSPSQEPDMVSSSSFDDPTNAEFSATPSDSCRCSPVCHCSPVCRCAESYGAEGEPVAVAEGTSLNGYAPIDSIEEGAPIGHGVNQYFGSAEGEEEALLDESTTDIGIEEGTSLEGFSGVDSVVVEAPLGHGVAQWYAEGDAADKTRCNPPCTPRDMIGQSWWKKLGYNTPCGCAHVDMVRNAEGDEPEPVFDDGITGQDGPSATPTNEHMVLSAEDFESYQAEGRTGFVFPKTKRWPIGNKKHAIKALNYMKGGFGLKKDYAKVRAAIKKKYGSLNLASEQGYNDKQDESLGMRHRGSHSQSHKDRRDEASAMDKRGRRGRKYDDVKAMDRFNAISSHRNRRGHYTGGQSVHNDDTGQFMNKGADTAGYLQDGSLSMDGYTPLESVDVDRTSYQPTQNYGAEFEGENLDTFKTGAFFGSGWVVGVGLLTAATIATITLGAKVIGK